MASRVSFYRPGGNFPAFSVTGGRCALQCDHCRGRYLQGMHTVGAPEELERAALHLSAQGGEGLLLSGGCDPQGRVPLHPFLGAVRRIKSRTSLAINLHPGLLDEAEAEMVAACGADAFSIDMVQDPATIEGTLHLHASPRDYALTLELLEPTRCVVPHVCVGLQSEEGEEGTFDLISSHRVRAVVVLGLMGARGTPWEGRSVKADRLSGAVRQAVSSNIPTVLGCMRPRGHWEVEVQAIQDGAAGVVNPSPRTVEWVKEKGYQVRDVPCCCALHL